jgi:hypothetical protein
MTITDVQVDQAAEIIERYVRTALGCGDDLSDATVYAADAVREAWRMGFVSEDSELNETAGTDDGRS